ncbi:MAG: hypothetical protein V1724_03300 [Chloroflexota bacterium]
MHSFQAFLLDLATIVFKTGGLDSQEEPTFERITTRTPLQQRAFDLLGVALK